MQRCPGPLSNNNRPRGAPPGMNVSDSQTLGLVRRALTDGGKLAQLRIRVVSLGDLKQPRTTTFYEHPPSSTPVLDFAACSWDSQINRYDYLRGPKKLTKN